MEAWIRELYWAAGFLEGEGYFTGKGIGKSSHRVGAGQRDKECLERLQRIFGGSIYFAHGNPEKNITSMHAWQLSDIASRGVMMTLYSLLSERRKESIRACLMTWKSHIPQMGLHARLKTHCIRGHLLSGDNMRRYQDKGNVRICIACKAMHSKAQAATRKRQRNAMKEENHG